MGRLIIGDGFTVNMNVSGSDLHVINKEGERTVLGGTALTFKSGSADETRISSSKGALQVASASFGGAAESGESLSIAGNMAFNNGGTVMWDPGGDDAISLRGISSKFRFTGGTGFGTDQLMEISQSGPEGSSVPMVGIGTLNAPKTLTVEGDISTSGDFYLENAESIRWAWDTPNNITMYATSKELYFYSGSASKTGFNFNYETVNDPRVGIGFNFQEHVRELNEFIFEWSPNKLNKDIINK